MNTTVLKFAGHPRIELIVRVVQTMALQGGTQIAAIALSALLARQLNPASFGQYAFGFHLATLVATIACMGAGTTMAKSWGETIGTAAERRRSIFRIHNYMLLRGALFIVASSIVFALFARSNLELASYLVVFPLFVVMQQFSFYMATDRAPTGNLLQFLRSTLSLAIAAVIVVLWTDRFAPAFVIGAIVAGSSVLAFGFLAWNASRHSFLSERPNQSEFRGFTIQHWASVLLVHADILLLRVFFDSESIAIYTVALFLTSACSFGLYAINANTVAKISDGATNLPRPKLQAQLSYYAWVSTGTSVVFMGIVLLFGQYTSVVFGQFYDESFYVFQILLIGQMLNVLCGSVALILNVFGQVRYVSHSLAVALLLKVIVSLMLIPWLGFWGVAIGAAVSTAFWNLSLLWVVLHRLGLNPTIFPFKCTETNACET